VILTIHASDDLLKRILTETKVIALVGASDKPNRASHGVMRFLQSRGYRVIPVNPVLAGKDLNGEKVYAGLKDIPQEKTGRIDMVDIFRNSADAAAPALEAIEIGAKFVWMQLGVVNEDAARKTRAAGLEVIMDHCPAIEYPRLMGGPEDH
jgi:predicted CoA-binding protein